MRSINCQTIGVKIRRVAESILPPGRTIVFGRDIIDVVQHHEQVGAKTNERVPGASLTKMRLLAATSAPRPPQLKRMSRSLPTR
ncbi:MAG: hypothetical protein ACLPYS_15195 [Vulcanimicrobiaceae bacterium]